MKTMLQGAKQTGQVERDNWQTPSYIIDRVVMFYGESWFDPCPSSANFDGLDTNWQNGAFINPPFSQYLAWVKHGEKQPPEQIWLCHHNHDTRWFQKLSQRATAFCWLKDRVRFVSPDTAEESKSTAIGKCQTLVYTGEQPEWFAVYFKGLGKIVIPGELTITRTRIEGVSR